MSSTKKSSAINVLKQGSFPLFASTPCVDPSSQRVVNSNSASTSFGEELVAVGNANGPNGHLKIPTKSQPSLSPIQSRVSLTENHNIRTVAGKEIRPVMDAMSLPKSPNSPYPFPTPECMKNVKIDKYKSVLTSLTILKSLSQLKEEMSMGEKKKQPTSTRPPRPGKDSSTRQVTKTSKEFQFTETMFKSNNTEAFLHVSYFLFNLLDKQKTQDSFRGIWPIYEKKTEGLYRRAAHSWFSEIVTENPKFFEGKVTVAQLQGLVVNHYGDRFIRFFHAFVNFVMLKVTSKEPAIPGMDGMKNILTHKPKYSGNPEVTKRQATLIHSKTQELETLAKTCCKKYMNNKIIFAKVTNKINSRISRDEKKLNQRTILLTKAIQQNPSNFPENALILLENHEDYFVNALKQYPAFHFQAYNRIPPHPLNQYTTEKWRECIKSVEEKSSRISDYFSQHSRLWTILSLSTQESCPQLDLAKLFYDLNPNVQKNLRLNDFFMNVARVFDEFHEHLKNETVSKDLQTRVQRLNSKIEMIRHSYQKIEEIQIPDVQKLKKQVEFDIKKLSMELEDVDWCKYSGLDDQPLASMFSFSPPRVIDITKKTGFTPALSSYLTFGATLENTQASSIKNIGDQTVTSQSSWRGRAAMNSTMLSQNIPESKGSLQPHSMQNVHHFTSMDSCDSPVSHLTRTVSNENYLLRSARHAKKSLSSSKIKQATIIEDSEFTGCNNAIVQNISAIHHETSNHSNNNSNNSATNSIDKLHSSSNFSLVDGEIPNINNSSRRKSVPERFQRIMEVMNSPETPVITERSQSSSRSFNRKSIENVTMREKSRSATPRLNESSSSLLEDLEQKLGILDISYSYADFLNLSKEDMDDF